jgi:hypothetical protein
MVPGIIFPSFYIATGHIHDNADKLMLSDC